MTGGPAGHGERRGFPRGRGGAVKGDHAVDEEPMLRRVDIGHAGMAALVVQIGGRDGADETIKRRLGVDGLARVEVAAARAGFRDAADMHEAGALA